MICHCLKVTESPSTNDTVPVSLGNIILLQAGILSYVVGDYHCPGEAYATYIILYGHGELIFLLALFKEYMQFL